MDQVTQQPNENVVPSSNQDTSNGVVDSTNIPTSTPTPGGETVLSQDQMKANLQDMMAKIDSKYQDFNKVKLSSDEKIKQVENDTLGKVFDLLKNAGIDPAKPVEVKSFLNTIKLGNPELFQRVEKTFQGLLEEDKNNMNINYKNEATPKTV